jgi:predicted ATP-grasp superfamily ATP-dependent carboligase
VLIVAASGRALAVSARRGGYVPLVVDAFGDQDTLAAAEAHTHVNLLDRQFDDEKVMGALARLAAGTVPVGVVCGSGFEDRTELLARIGARWPLLGNAPETIARLKDPLGFAVLCREADVPHPETSPLCPADREGWLIKRAGGAGGWHIRPVSEDDVTADGVYFQRFVAGRPVSALLLGDGNRSIVLGYSEQWCSPLPQHPFRYGGAVRPVPLSNRLVRQLTAALARLTAVQPLTGLNSADFLVDGETFYLLEINPRPGATFDLFEPEERESLFALHLDACAGVLPDVPPRFDGGKAGAILYAAHDIDRMLAREWPVWVSDRPTVGSEVKANAPLCSVFAKGATAIEARRLLEWRMAQIETWLREPVA